MGSRSQGTPRQRGGRGSSPTGLPPSPPCFPVGGSGHVLRVDGGDRPATQPLSGRTGLWPRGGAHPPGRPTCQPVTRRPSSGNRGSLPVQESGVDVPARESSSSPSEPGALTLGATPTPLLPALVPQVTPLPACPGLPRSPSAPPRSVPRSARRPSPLVPRARCWGALDRPRRESSRPSRPGPPPAALPAALPAWDLGSTRGHPSPDPIPRVCGIHLGVQPLEPLISTDAPSSQALAHPPTSSWVKRDRLSAPACRFSPAADTWALGTGRPLGEPEGPRSPSLHVERLRRHEGTRHEPRQDQDGRAGAAFPCPLLSPPGPRAPSLPAQPHVPAPRGSLSSSPSLQNA